MTQTCRNCNTYVPQGRTYCDAHYQQAYANYEADYANYEAALERYYIDLEAWNALSIEEQNSRHKFAEDESLKAIGIFAGLIVGGGYWFINSEEISWWFGALITMAAVAFFYVTRKLFSRLFRGFGYGIVWGIIFIILGWVAHFILNLIDPSILLMGTNEGEDSEFSTTAHTLLGLTGLVTGLWREFTGDHHAYGGPVAPTEPSPPSP